MSNYLKALLLALLCVTTAALADYYYDFDGTGNWTWEDTDYIWEAPPEAQFDIDDDYRSAYDDYSTTTQAGDSFGVRVNYEDHSDGNSRQLIIVGFVGSIEEALSDFDDAVFVYLANYYGNPVVIPYACDNGSTMNLTGDYPPPSWQQGYGEYDYWIDIISSSEYRTRCWKDGSLVWDSTNSGDLTGLSLNFAAVFNTRTSGYPLQGYHQGSVDYLYWGSDSGHPVVEESWGRIKALQ